MKPDVLVLIPLDDRPPTFVFPQRIASVAGIRLVVPPRSLLGNFLQPGDSARLGEWLEGQAKEADCVIVAADMLAYGGLVASRSPETSLEEALRRVEVLQRIKQKNKNLSLLAASVIMRISITAADSRTAAYYQKLIRYSELSWLVETQGREDLRQIYERVQKSILPEVIQAYLQARQRNHAVNRRMIEMAAEGILDGLILLQEDASLAGPHLKEQTQLRELAQTLGIDTQIQIYPGADEGTQTLLARWLNRENPPSIYPIFTSRSGADQAAPYEDRPLYQTVSSHLVAAGIALSDATGCDAILWVHTPCSDSEAYQAADAIETLLKAGRVVGLADVRYPNGGDSELMKILCERGLLPRLTAYSGWNTAGNTIGTAIAHLSAWFEAQRNGFSDRQCKAHLMFQWERFLDDWGYQREVRSKIEKELRQRGLDPLNLQAAKSQVESEVAEKLVQWANTLCLCEGWVGYTPELDIRLPWPRTFEVELTTRLPELP